MRNNDKIIAEIREAIHAHGTWKLRLSTAIATGKSDADPYTTKCDNLCAFGQWLYGPTIDSATRAGKPYQVVKRLHAEFHDTASRVLDLALSGRKQEARMLMDDEYAQRSDKLIRALTKWRKELTVANVA